MACCLDQSRIIGNKLAGVTAFTATANSRVYTRQEVRGHKAASACVIVAHAALTLGRNVIDLLGCCDTGVMAGCTIATYDIQIMHKGTCEGAEAVVDDMTGRAVQTGRNMTCRFSSAYITIMAGQAVAGIRAGMVKQCSDKAGCRMTVGAILIVRCCRYVIEEFSYADPVVVTRITAIDDAGVVIGTGTERTRCMTNTAVLAGRHVCIERRAWGHAARRTGAIRYMAGDATIINNARMIDTECRAEAQGVMTETAIRTGWRVAGHC